MCSLSLRKRGVCFHVFAVLCEERTPTRCNNIDDLLSIVDVDYRQVSTCFGHLYAHRQEKRPFVTAYGVYLL